MVSIAKKPAVRILGKPPVSLPAAVPTTRKPQPSIKPRKQANGSYMVDSATSTLVSYSVRNLEHGWQCDCPAGAFHNACWHVTAVLAVEAAQQDVAWLTDDLEAITEHIAGGGGDGAPAVAPSAPDVLYYRDGTQKPYTSRDVRDGSFVRKAQATWDWLDGEAA